MKIFVLNILEEPKIDGIISKLRHKEEINPDNDLRA